MLHVAPQSSIFNSVVCTYHDNEVDSDSDSDSLRFLEEERNNPGENWYNLLFLGHSSQNTWVRPITP